MIDNTWTLDALQRGDIKSVQKRVLEDADYINERDYVGNTPLLTAIEFNDCQLVSFLLKHGANPNIDVDDGYTPLLTAIEDETGESNAIVKELIQRGADIHATGIHGWAPLHMAAARGCSELVEILIKAGAEVNQRTEIDGHDTPLMEAAFSGRPETVSLLLAHGADPNMRDIIYEYTPLEIAKEALKGALPEVIDTLKNQEPIEVNELFEDEDWTKEQKEMMRQSVENIDMVQNYIDSSNSLIQEGDHKEVIRILSSFVV